jgi:hypothetical protein
VIDTWRDRLSVAHAKLANYLLAVEHIEGGPKATFFLALGFSTSEPEALGDALLRHGRSQELMRTVETPFGRRYVVEGSIESPSGSAVIRSVWTEREAEGPVWLVTSYPLRRRQ